MKTPVLAAIIIGGAAVAGAGIAFAIAASKNGFQSENAPSEIDGRAVITVSTEADPPVQMAAITTETTSANPAPQHSVPSDQLEFFEKHIRPALLKYCYDCHSVIEETSRGGLVLDSREGWQQGGDGGPAIKPGDLQGSLFWKAINYHGKLEMPPDDKMPADVIAHFKTWIEMGAPDPRMRQKAAFKTVITAADIEEGRRTHWSFQKPTAKAGATIDGIVAAKLQQAGLNPSEPADAYTLLRRINFDLIGLPPSLSEIQQFQIAWQRDRATAIEQKVDQLLKRQQYGERWGRHWMDVARYAESSGGRNFSFPQAWRYRDYIIDSFNDDTPYDRFIMEQIAGDLLPVKTDEQWQENLIATGFLAIGLKHLDQKNPRIFEADMIAEQIDTMTQALQGLTVACARCHDHKHDPIPTADYYAMEGIFRSTRTLYGTARVAQNHRATDLLLLPILDKNPLGGSRGRTRSVAEMKASLAKTQAQIREMGGRRKSKDVSGEAFNKVRELQRNAQRIQAELDRRNPDGSLKTFGMGVQEGAKMVDSPILVRGEVDQPAQTVQRGYVQVLGDLNFKTTSRKSSGRKELAAAMASRDNPLTARVMANRIWMHLTGKPLVGTPNNFGISGMRPDNQELLDHLAVRFMEQGWSIKSLIKEIVLSQTYQRSSEYNAQNYAKDPANKLLWRANSRALDAESMRDAMLTLSGRINYQRPHASVVAEAGDGHASAGGVDANNPMRSVYLPVIRDKPDESLKLFDFPDSNITSAGRSQSIIPTQALFMMNSDFAAAQAAGMAKLIGARYRTPTDQIRHAFLWAYGRPATAVEEQAAGQFFQQYQPTRVVAAVTTTASQAPQGKSKSKGGKAGKGGKKGGKKGKAGAAANSATTAANVMNNNQTLTVFCQTLMASARFRILN